jgi:hypothetical protein
VAIPSLNHAQRAKKNRKDVALPGYVPAIPDESVVLATTRG